MPRTVPSIATVPLRWAGFAYFLLALGFAGCGDDDGSTAAVDSGVAPTDSGTGRIDSGEPRVDAGDTPRTCGGSMCQLPDGSGCDTGSGCFYLIDPDDAMSGPQAVCQTLPAMPTATGGACMRSQDCAAGNHCDIPEGEAEGVCRKLCCWGSNLACPTGESCAVRFQQNDTGTDVGFCRPSDGCSLLGQDECAPGADGCCAAGEGCYPLGSDGGTECIPAGSVTTGAECGAMAPCEVGSGCFTLDMMGPATCFGFCEVDGDSCPEGQRCNPAGYPAPADTIGICIPVT